MAYAFKDRLDATTLKRMAQEYRGNTRPLLPTSSIQPASVTPLRHYLLVPIEDIPPAQRVLVQEDGQPRQKLILGSGLCAIHRRQASDSAQDWFEANDGSNLHTKYQRDPDSLEPVYVRAYNTSDNGYVTEGGDGKDIPDCGPVLHAVSDMWGTLFIVRACSLVDCSSSLSSASGSFSPCAVTVSFKEHRLVDLVGGSA